MATLTIDEINDRVILSTYDEASDYKGKAFILGTIDCALGNIIDTLQSQFNIKEIGQLPNMIVNPLKKRLSDNDIFYDLFGFIRCRKTNLVPIMVFLSQNEGEKLTLNTVEDFRNDYKLHVFPPIKNDIDGAISYNASVFNIHDIFYVLLWYYAYNEKKITKCVHCKRWYATASLKNLYCDRKSLMKKYSHLSCYEATKNCKRDCLRIKNRIETKARLYFDNHIGAHNNMSLQTSPFVYKFQEECETMSKNKSVKAHDLEEYFTFLKETENNKTWLKE